MNIKYPLCLSSRRNNLRAIAHCQSIVNTPRYNSPYPASRLLHIPDISQNHMTMAVHHRLPCHLTDIKPDVVSGWRQILLNHFFTLIDQRKHSMFLLNRQGKIISHMPERDHEQVPPAGCGTPLVQEPQTIIPSVFPHHKINYPSPPTRRYAPAPQRHCVPRHPLSVTTTPIPS